MCARHVAKKMEQNICEIAIELFVYRQFHELTFKERPKKVVNFL